MAVMNALMPIVMDFRPAYDQLDAAERRFVDAYVTDLESIAEKTGQRLKVVLSQPYPYTLDPRALALLASALVRTAICERVKTLSELVDTTPYRVLKEQAVLAFSNVANYMRFDTIIPEFDLSKTTYEQLAAIKTFEVEEKPRGGRKIKMTLHDKPSALAKLMEYHGLTKPDNSHWQEANRAERSIDAPMIPADADDETAGRMYGDFTNKD